MIYDLLKALLIVCLCVLPYLVCEVRAENVRIRARMEALHAATEYRS